VVRKQCCQLWYSANPLIFSLSQHNTHTDHSDWHCLVYQLNNFGFCSITVSRQYYATLSLLCSVSFKPRTSSASRLWTVVMRHLLKTYQHSKKTSDSRLGGVVVSVLVTGLKPGRGDEFLRAIKIRSTPSFGWEVKVEVPHRRILWQVKVRWRISDTDKQNSYSFVHSSYSLSDVFW
jgi:hypothetical protein